MEDNYLYGIDISKWQDESIYATFDKYEFVIAKATEGKTYTDPMFVKHINRALEEEKLIGAYHYARPDNNNAKDDALNFVNAIGPYYKTGMLLALDWEQKSWNYPIEWAIEWLELVYKWTGIKPVFYASAGLLTTDCDKIEKAGFGLWSADYSTRSLKDTRTNPFSNWVLRQIGSNPVDQDVFNGNYEKWKEITTPEWLNEVPDVPKSTEEEKEKDKPVECDCTVCSLLRKYGYILKEESILNLSKIK